MKRLPPTDLAALIALVGLGIGVALTYSVGHALIVVSALVLLYLILPDRGAA